MIVGYNSANLPYYRQLSLLKILWSTLTFFFELLPLPEELRPRELPIAILRPGIVPSDGVVRLSNVSIFMFNIPADSLPICIFPLFE